MTDAEIRKRLEKALARCETHTIEDVLALIQQGKAQLFKNEHGVWITEIYQYPRMKALNVWLMAGELPGLLDLQPTVLEYARQQGCKRVIGSARPGWGRTLAAKYNWKVEALQLSQEV